MEQGEVSAAYTWDINTFGDQTKSDYVHGR